MKLKINNSYEHKITFSQNDVNKFAEVTSDNNPIHLDEEYASKTIFKRRIVHGFLAGAVFSRVFGTIFPGYGTIYLYQEMKFKKPVYTDVEYTALFIVKEIINEKNIANVLCSLIDQKGNICIEGNATIMNKAKII